MSYTQEARDALRTRLGEEEWGGLSERLADLYTLLVLTQGGGVSGAAVHDAWALDCERDRPEHRSLIPYGELSPEVQMMDEPYRTAIRDAAYDLTNG